VSGVLDFPARHDPLFGDNFPLCAPGGSAAGDQLLIRRRNAYASAYSRRGTSLDATICTRSPIAAYFAADKAGDADTLARVFAEHGPSFVIEGGEFVGVTGHSEVDTPSRTLKFTHRSSHSVHSRGTGRRSSSEGWSGDFPNSPLSLEHVLSVLEARTRSQPSRFR